MWWWRDVSRWTVAGAVAAALLAGACGDSVAAQDGGDADGAVAPDEDAVPDGPVAPDWDVAMDGDGAAPVTCEPGACCAPAGWDEAPFTRTFDGWQVRVWPATGAWSVTGPGALGVVLAGPGGCDAALQVARVSVPVSGQPAVERQFGAFKIDLEAVTWVAAAPDSGPSRIDDDADALTVWWPLADGMGEVGVTFSAYGEAGALRVGLAVAREGAPAGGRLGWTMKTNEGVFGLGTQVPGLDLRGHRYPLWTQEQGIGKLPDPVLWPLQNTPEAAYAPMGVWHTSAGLSALADFDAYGELDVRPADHATLRTWGQAPAFVLLPGDTPAQRVQALTELTGRIQRPSDWTFAPWNDAVGGPDRLYAVASALRDADIPSGAIWSEDWIGGEEGTTGFRLSYAWEWDPTLYPNLPTDIAALHTQGFAFLGYFNSFVPKPTRMFQEGAEGGFLIQDSAGEPYIFDDPAFRPASLVDLTNPDAVAWLKAYLTTAAGTLGMDGWMADFGEWLPSDCVLRSGEDPWVVHNRYPLLWQQVNTEVMTDLHGGGPDTAEGWTFFARSGWASTWGASASRTPTMWGGDQNTDWGRDDGFPSVLPLTLHAGLSGVPILATDIAGYSSFTTPPTDKELFYRWASQGALTPLMRTHHGSSQCANWAFDRDAETLQHYRRWAKVHVLLYPLWRALTDAAVATGLPVMRHPWLVEPQRESLWREARDLYFLGDDVLVAPEMEEGVFERTVVLPAAGWWPLFAAAPVQTNAPTAETLADGALRVTVPAPVTEVPAFVRPGTAIPLLPHAVDTLYAPAPPDPELAPEVTSLASVEGWRRAALYPDANGQIRPMKVGAVRVSASGLAVPVDWSAATFDGAALAPCGSVGEGQICRLDDGAGVRVVGPGTVGVGDGVVVLEALSGDAGAATQATELAVAGAAWGELVTPTPMTDLAPDIPPPCEP